jgi:hypothetical protein
MRPWGNIYLHFLLGQYLTFLCQAINFVRNDRTNSFLLNILIINLSNYIYLDVIYKKTMPIFKGVNLKEKN